MCFGTTENGLIERDELVPIVRKFWKDPSDEEKELKEAFLVSVVKGRCVAGG